MMHVACMREMRNSYKSWSENTKDETMWELDDHGRIVLKWTLKIE